jgi:hypothetical protein
MAGPKYDQNLQRMVLERTSASTGPVFPLASKPRPIAIPKITPMQIFVTLWY